MLARGALLVLFFLSLAGAFWISREHEYLFLFWIPLPIVCAFTFLIFGKRQIFRLLSLPLVLVMCLQMWIHGMWISISLYMAVYFLIGVCLERLQYRIQAEILTNGKVVERSNRSLQVIQKRSTKEEERIGEFQKKVNSLTRLFEMAKDFNACMTFDSLLPTVRRTLSDFLSLKRLRLIVLPSEVSGLGLRAFEIVGNQPGPWTFTETLSQDDLTRLEILNEIERIDSSQDRNFPGASIYEDNLESPLWIFPLRIESNTIAVLFVEGAAEKDFYSVQIVAGQLALQIHKTVLYERVHSLSLYDGLTKVFVRRHLEERLTEELRRSFENKLQFSVMMLDLDHFKSFNDRYGHLVGDQILRDVAGILQEEVRTVDLVGRFGGEEFIIILPETDGEGVAEVAERIRSAVAKKKFKVYDESLRATISIGVSTFPNDVTEAQKSGYKSEWQQQLIDRADEALYQAKDDGRNRVERYERKHQE